MNGLWIGPVTVVVLLAPLPAILLADWVRAATCAHSARTVNMDRVTVCLHCRKVLP